MAWGRGPAACFHLYLAALLLLLAAPGAWAQPGAPLWQRPITTTQGINSRVSVFATATNAAGDVFMAGQFEGTAIFGSTTLLSTYTLASSGRHVRSSDVFIAKWSKTSGQFMWAVQAGSAELDNVNYLIVRGTAVYLGGTFAGDTLRLGATQVFAPASVTYYNAKTYVARLTDAGSSASVGWAISLVPALTGMAVTPAGVHLMGRYNSTVQFGAFTLTNPMLSAGSPSNGTFLATLGETANGPSFTAAHKLTRRSSSTNDEGELGSQTLTADGNCLYLTGGVGAGTVLVDNIPVATVLASAGSLFVMKLTVSATVLATNWLTSTPSPQSAILWDVQVRALAVSGTGIFLTGSFIGALKIGVDTLFASGGIVNRQYADSFVAKLTDNGTSGRFDWGLRAGNKGTGIGQGIAVRGTEIFWSASFATTDQGHNVTFGSAPFVLGGNYFANYLVIAKMVDSGRSGRFDWAKSGGGGTYSQVGNVALANDGTMYTAVTMGGSGGFGQYNVSVGAGLNGQGNGAGVVAAIFGTTALAGRPAAGPLAGTSLYPNPAHATATVQLPSVSGASAATLTLLDALGRVVRTATVPLSAAGLRHALDLAGLPVGLYALRVAAGDRTATHRLVVE